MAIPIWPLGLPQKPLRDGYQESYPNNLLRYEPDSGIAKVRRKSGLVAWKISMSFLVTTPQKDLLEEFVTSTLSMGALRFSFSHPTKDENVEVRIVPTEEQLFIFSPVGQCRFNIRMVLEVLP